MEKRNIPISLPVTGDEEWHACREPLVTGWITSGPKVSEFEKLFAERHNVDYAIAVTSATTALHLALVAVGVGTGDEVIVPAFTWVSTANVVLYCGAKVVFVDIDPTTFNLDTTKLATKITEKTKAIIPVHLFGLCADMDKIKEVAGDIPLIEDGACAAGAGYKGKQAGSLGTIGCFSFHPRKSVTTGEGGMLSMNSFKIYEKCKSLRNLCFGKLNRFNHDDIGWNFRMTNMQAALGLSQLKNIKHVIKKKWKLANITIKSYIKIPIYKYYLPQMNFQKIFIG